jgi:uncharacterized membrane protein
MADEKEVIVTRDGGGGGGMTLLAVVLLIVAIGVLVFLLRGNLFGGETKKIDADVTVEAPSK